MLYFSSEVKMERPKQKWGGKGKWGPTNFFAPELGPLTFNLFPTPMNLPRLRDVTLMYWCAKTYFNRKSHKILLLNSQQKLLHFGFQMSDVKAKMHQIRFRLGLRPRPRSGSLQRSPRPLAGFKGATSKGREGRRKGKGEKVGERGGEGMEEEFVSS